MLAVLPSLEWDRDRSWYRDSRDDDFGFDSPGNYDQPITYNYVKDKYNWWIIPNVESDLELKAWIAFYIVPIF